MSTTPGRPEPAEIFQSHFNASGFPFQYAVLRRIERLSEHGSPWLFQASELPVEVADASTRIDFVLGRWVQHAGAFRAYLVAECKRANPALGRWLFARAPYVRRDAQPATPLMETLQRVRIPSKEDRLFAGFRRFRECAGVYHVALEARTDRKGDAHGGSRGAIEEASTQVMRGVNGLVEALARRPLILPPNDYVPLVPAIFTTAELWTTDIDLATADLASGEVAMPPGAVTRAPWLWYQYHVSPGLRHAVQTYFQESGAPPFSEGLAPMLDQEFARTIAVVSPDGIDDFLRNGLREV